MPPNQTANELKLGILGRTQREDSIELCHFIDMNNHSHNLVVSKEPEGLSKFYMELQKKTTDTVKALLGRPTLKLWEDRTTTAMIATLEDVINRIIYIYCNPSKASLCESIEEYPGLSSWSAFVECAPSVDAEVSREVRWYPLSQIPRLPKLSLSYKQDVCLHQKLRDAKRAVKHTLVLKPFKWLEPFGITAPEAIERIRHRIIGRVKEQEQEYAKARAIAGKKCAVGSILQQAPFLRPHNPKKKERKIFLICSNTEYRLRLLAGFKETFTRCRECYQKAKEGIRVEWPPGTFVPWFPPGFCFPLPAAP